MKTGNISPGDFEDRILQFKQRVTGGGHVAQ